MGRLACALVSMALGEGIAPPPTFVALWMYPGGLHNARGGEGEPTDQGGTRGHPRGMSRSEAGSPVPESSTELPGGSSAARDLRAIPFSLTEGGLLTGVPFQAPAHCKSLRWPVLRAQGWYFQAIGSNMGQGSQCPAPPCRTRIGSCTLP